VRRSVSAGSLVTLFFSFLANVAGAQSIQLSVDLSDAPRNIYHSQLTIPVKPGPLTLVYPEWIPGNHRPAGPIANVTGIKMEANKQTLAWQRDPIDMYAFHVDVPAGASELKVSLDTITNDGSAAADNVELSGSAPSGWKVEFDKKTIDRIAPDQMAEVNALVTPTDKSIAGDYMATIRAASRGESASTQFRVTVATSTVWGFAAFGIIAVALLVMFGAVARFGRR